MNKFSARFECKQKGIVDPKIIIGGIVVLAILFFLFTGKFKFSASRTDQPQAQQNESPQEEKVEPKDYQNVDKKIKLKYPGNWELKENSDGYNAIFMSPLESSSDKYREFVALKVVSTENYPNLTLDEIVQTWEKETAEQTTNSDYKIVERNPSTVSGNDAKDLVYEITVKNLPAKTLVRITMANDNAYIFKYYAEADKYDATLPQAEEIFSSINLQ